MCKVPLLTWILFCSTKIKVQLVHFPPAEQPHCRLCSPWDTFETFRIDSNHLHSLVHKAIGELQKKIASFIWHTVFAWNGQTGKINTTKNWTLVFHCFGGAWSVAGILNSKNAKRQNTGGWAVHVFVRCDNIVGSTYISSENLCGKQGSQAFLGKSLPVEH